MNINREKLIEFIVEKRKAKEFVEVGSVLHGRGFIDACNEILDFVHDAPQEKSE